MKPNRSQMPERAGNVVTKAFPPRSQLPVSKTRAMYYSCCVVHVSCVTPNDGVLCLQMLTELLRCNVTRDNMQEHGSGCEKTRGLQYDQPKKVLLVVLSCFAVVF